MKMNLLIHACGGFRQPAGEVDSDLTPRLRSCPYRVGRRADRLTGLALLGLARCLRDEPPEPETRMILASGDGNLNNAILMNREIFANALIPSPIDFINSLNNSTCFYLSQAIGINGEMITVSRDTASLEAGFQMAAILMQESPGPLLVGTADEIPADQNNHRRRIGLECDAVLGEGSHWFFSRPETDGAIAAIRYAGRVGSVTELEALMKESGVSTFSATDSVANDLRKRLNSQAHEVKFASPGFYPVQNGYWLSGWLGQEQTDADGRYALINQRQSSDELSLIIAERP